MRRIGLTLCLASLAGIALVAQSGMVSYQQLTVNASSAAQSIAASTLQPVGMAAPLRCALRVESSSVHYRMDGTAATSTVGTPMLPADEPLVLSIQDATRLSLQGHVSATTALVHVHCGR